MQKRVFCLLFALCLSIALSAAVKFDPFAKGFSTFVENGASDTSAFPLISSEVGVSSLEPISSTILESSPGGLLYTFKPRSHTQGIIPLVTYLKMEDGTLLFTNYWAIGDKPRPTVRV